MRSARVVSLLLVASAVAAARADELVLLDRAGRIRSIVTESGDLGDQQILIGIRKRPWVQAIATQPVTGVLYGLLGDGLCTIDPSTGWVTPLGPGPEGDGGSLSFPGTSLDIDPVSNEVRALVHTNGSATDTRILRYDATTGALVGSSPSDLPALAYKGPGAGPLPVGGSIAHLFDGTVIGIDPALRRLFSIRSPAEDGVLEATAILSGLGNTSGHFCMEIVPSGTAYVLENEPTTFEPAIVVYRLDLATGVATRVSSTRPPPMALFPHDVATAPFAPSSPLRTLDLTAAKLSLDFVKPRRDVLEIRGTLPEPLAGWEGKTVRVCIRPFENQFEQHNREFVLDSRGRSRTTTDSFSVGAKAKDGAVPFVLRLSGTQLEAYGIGFSLRANTINSLVDLLVDGHPFRADLDLRYSRRKGARRGMAVRIPSETK